MRRIFYDFKFWAILSAVFFIISIIIGVIAYRYYCDYTYYSERYYSESSRYYTLDKEYGSLWREKNNLIKQNESLKAENESLLSDLRYYDFNMVKWQEQYELIKNELDFYHGHVALVLDDGSREYHTFGCEKFMQKAKILYGFKVYGTNDAQSYDYYPCFDCH